MNAKILRVSLPLSWLLALAPSLPAQEKPPETKVEAAASGQEKKDQPSAQSNTGANRQGTLQLGIVQIGGLWYISYQQGDAYAQVPGETADYSQFRIKRGYINIQAELQPWLDVRVTPDVVQDQTGDVKVRIKYLYARFKTRGVGILQKPYAQFGVVHMPWLDFEEHVNRFRMQDTMFMERNNLFNSADIGFILGSNFGPDLPGEYRNEVNGSYAGRYGSWQFGVYNGGGFTASEKNNNKVVEARGTVRPLPGSLPGLQLSLFGVHGKGNLPEPPPPAMLPDYDVLAGMVSYEHQYFVLTGQWYGGEGNAAGTAVRPDGTARPQQGSSYFGELRFTGKRNFSLIGRYDRFKTDTGDTQSDLQQRWIVGFAWQMFKNNYWLVDYDRLSHSLVEVPNEDRFQVTLQISF